MQVPQLMQELKAANVDVVVTVSYPAAAAAKGAPAKGGDKGAAKKEEGKRK